MPYPADLSFAPESIVVLIGTTVCTNDMETLKPLPHVERNVYHLKRLLEDPDIVGLPPENIVLILDCSESSAIVDTVAKQAARATDTLVVYYAGHGLYGDQREQLYLTSTNTTMERKEFNAVKISDVKLAIGESPARKRILILDCCHAGRGIPAGLMSSAAVEEQIKVAIDLKGTYGIAAVPADQRALAPPGETLTRFTQSLVNVLENGIKDAGSELTLEEVFKSVKAEISRFPGMPLPQRNNWEDGEKFKIARNRYLKQSGLETVIRGLEGLRQTVSQTGAKIEAIESRVGSLEKSNQNDRVKARTEKVPVWTRLNLTKADWDKLPVVPWKFFVRTYFEGKRNAQIALLAMLVPGLLAFLLNCIPLAPNDSGNASDSDGIYLVSAVLILAGACPIVVLGTWSLLILYFWGMRNDFGHFESKGEIKELSTIANSAFPDADQNELLQEMLNSRRLSFVGAPFSERLTYAAIGLGALISIFAILVGLRGYTDYHTFAELKSMLSNISRS